MEESKILIFSSKFQWTFERISLKFMYNFDTHPQKSFARPDSWQMYKNKTIHIHSFGSKRRVNIPTVSTAVQSRTSDLLD
jgi:hypothetical protein